MVGEEAVLFGEVQEEGVAVPGEKTRGRAHPQNPFLVHGEGQGSELSLQRGLLECFCVEMIAGEAFFPFRADPQVIFHGIIVQGRDAVSHQSFPLRITGPCPGDGIIPGESVVGAGPDVSCTVDGERSDDLIPVEILVQIKIVKESLLLQVILKDTPLVSAYPQVPGGIPDDGADMILYAVLLAVVIAEFLPARGIRCINGDTVVGAEPVIPVTGLADRPYRRTAQPVTYPDGDELFSLENAQAMVTCTDQQIAFMVFCKALDRVVIQSVVRIVCLEITVPYPGDPPAESTYPDISAAVLVKTAYPVFGQTVPFVVNEHGIPFFIIYI